VIRFEQQQIGTAQVVADGIRQIAQVGGDGDFDAFGPERKSNRIGRVVRDREAGDVDITDGEARSSLEQLQVRRVFIPRNRRRGEARYIDGNFQLAGENLQAADVIGMLMRDEDGVQRFGRASGGVEP